MSTSTIPAPVAAFLAEVAAEIESATLKHPGPNPNMAALTEEVGELAQALLAARSAQRDFGHVHEGYLSHIRDEAIQVATMAFRVAFEGDPTLDVVMPFEPALDIDDLVDEENQQKVGALVAAMQEASKVQPEPGAKS